MPKQLILTGGTSRSRNFCQLFADVLQIEIILLDKKQNIGLLGVLSSCGIEIMESTNNEKIEVFTPNKDKESYYAIKFEIYRKTYPRLEPIYKMLSSITL